MLLQGLLLLWQHLHVLRYVSLRCDFEPFGRVSASSDCAATTVYGTRARALAKTKGKDRRKHKSKSRSKRSNNNNNSNCCNLQHFLYGAATNYRFCYCRRRCCCWCLLLLVSVATLANNCTFLSVFVCVRVYCCWCRELKLKLEKCVGFLAFHSSRRAVKIRGKYRKCRQLAAH